MVKQLLITGYYKKQNIGDDLFETIANKLFSNNKNYKITIKSIDDNYNDDYDEVLLFGGETLNEYFLKPLSKIKEKNQNIKMYAIGVNLGADIDSIKQYLIMFQYIIVRNTEDYNKIIKYVHCYYVQDPVFIISSMKFMKNNDIKKENSIGLFLSQPKLKNVENIENYINIINYFVNKKITVKLFSMCYSNNPNESDIIINERIYNNLNPDIKKSVKIIPNKYFGKHIKTLKYAICERFHAHILCIIYNIPFISLANTNKVKQLLFDLKLLDNDNNNDNPEIIYNKLKNINTKKLKKIYNTTFNNVGEFYNKLMKNNLDDMIIYPKNKTKFYFNNSIIDSQSNKIFNNCNNADDILMKLFGTTNLDYKWGLNEKIKNGSISIDDIKWLYYESIYNYYYLHYKNNNLNINDSTNILKNNSKNICIDYINQYDNSNCHRSGWRYVIDYINYNLATSNKYAIKCDLYVDRTFHWCNDIMVNNNIIPYKEHWIGFIHHTLYKENDYNCIELLKNKYFIESLKTCKALIFLSTKLKDDFNNLAKTNNINLPKLFNLYHPTEFNDEINYNWHYKKWKGEIIQIGSWMRDINAIYELKYNKKYALIGKNMNNKYICCLYNNNNNYYNNNNNNDVKIIEYLDNPQYDEILSKYVVFVKLFDASAVNTLIECIVRNTPIIINKLPAVVEYLGDNYPLYYNNLEDVPRLLQTGLFKTNHIKKAHEYLKRMNKDFLKIETFINSLKKII